VSFVNQRLLSFVLRSNLASHSLFICSIYSLHSYAFVSSSASFSRVMTSTLSSHSLRR
jgi:hypothetical protein